MAIGLADLERRLWDAANALGGPVDSADFKTYVFPMLFWKWISDSWAWEHAVADYRGDVAPEVEADYHRFDLPPGTYWRDVAVKTANLGAAIAKALGKIEQANPDPIEAVRALVERAELDLGIDRALPVTGPIFDQGYAYIRENY